MDTNSEQEAIRPEAMPNQVSEILGQLPSSQPAEKLGWRERLTKNHLLSYISGNLLNQGVNAELQREHLKSVKHAKERGRRIQNARDQMAANSLGASLQSPAVDQDADEMKISLDSPSTTNNIQLPPEAFGKAVKPAMSLAKKLGIAALLGGTGLALPVAGGIAAYKALGHLGMLKPERETIIEEKLTDRVIEIEVEQKDGKWSVVDTVDITD